MPTTDPDAMREDDIKNGPPPLSDAGVVDFITFWIKAEQGFYDNDEIAAKFFYLAPRLIRRLREGREAAPVYTIPPPGSQGEAEMNAGRTAEIVGHPMIGLDVTIHLSSGETVGGHISDFDGMILTVAVTGGQRSFIPITSVDVVRVEKMLIKANAEDYEADLPGKD